jgi:hypothetical protein
LARQSKGLGHREQPKISEEGIWPSRVNAKASALTRTMKLSAHDRSQTAMNKAVDGREGVAIGMLEIAEPATQEWIDRGNGVLDRVTPITPGQGPDFIPQPHETAVSESPRAAVTRARWAPSTPLVGALNEKDETRWRNTRTAHDDTGISAASPAANCR